MPAKPEHSFDPVSDNPETEQGKQFAGEKFNWLDCVARDKRLKPAAFKVAYVIMQHVNAKTGIAWVSDETLADVCGISAPMVFRHRESLKAAGWLSWERTQNANHYKPLFHQVNAGLDAMIVQRERRKELRDLRRKFLSARPPNSGSDSSLVMKGKFPIHHG